MTSLTGTAKPAESGALLAHREYVPGAVKVLSFSDQVARAHAKAPRGARFDAPFNATSIFELLLTTWSALAFFSQRSGPECHKCLGPDQVHQLAWRTLQTLARHSFPRGQNGYSFHYSRRAFTHNRQLNIVAVELEVLFIYRRDQRTFIVGNTASEHRFDEPGSTPGGCPANTLPRP